MFAGNNGNGGSAIAESLVFKESLLNDSFNVYNFEIFNSSLSFEPTKRSQSQQLQLQTNHHQQHQKQKRLLLQQQQQQQQQLQQQQQQQRWTTFSRSNETSSIKSQFLLNKQRLQRLYDDKNDDDDDDDDQEDDDDNNGNYSRVCDNYDNMVNNNDDFEMIDDSDDTATTARPTATTTRKVSSTASAQKASDENERPLTKRVRQDFGESVSFAADSVSIATAAAAAVDRKPCVCFNCSAASPASQPLTSYMSSREFGFDSLRQALLGDELIVCQNAGKFCIGDSTFSTANCDDKSKATKKQAATIADDFNAHDDDDAAAMSDLSLSSSSASSAASSTWSSTANSPAASGDENELDAVEAQDGSGSMFDLLTTPGFANSQHHAWFQQNCIGKLEIKRPIQNLLRYNLTDLNLTQKDTLLFLIERNRASNILAPFDMFVYGRLKPSNNKYQVSFALPQQQKKQQQQQQQQLLQMNRQQPEASSVRRRSARATTHSAPAAGDKSKHNYNYSNIKKLSELAKTIGSPLDKSYLRQNKLLPGSVATYLMPFFFDIFRMSEVHALSKPTVDMMTQLKKSFRSQLHLDYEALVAHMPENLLWNCFVCLKYKVAAEDAETRMGYLNYYLSHLYVLIHFEMVFMHSGRLAPDSQPFTYRELVRRHYVQSAELNAMLPCLLEALVLNGLFRHVDYLRFRSFYRSKLPFGLEPTASPFDKFYLNGRDAAAIATTSTATATATTPPMTKGSAQQRHYRDDHDLKSTYLHVAMRSLDAKVANLFPLQLKNLCRIQIKQSLVAFNTATINKLNIPKSMKTFLFFDDELETFYVNHRRLLHNCPPPP